MPLPAALEPLRHRQYRWLFSSQVVSNLGDWLDFLALVVLVTFSWHRGVEGMAALVIAMAAPAIVLAPIAGVLADRLPPRTAMVACDLARCAAVAALVVAPNLYVVVGLVAVRDSFSTLFTPAQQIAIRLTVPEKSLLSASSLSQLVLQGSKIVGPALGGVLVAAFGSPRPVFLVDAASFLVSALLLLPLRVARQPDAVGEAARQEDATRDSGMLDEARSGLRYLAGRPVLATAVGGFSVLLFLALLFDTLAPLVLNALGFDSRMLGLAMGAIGLGTVLGALALGQFAERINPLALMGAGSCLCGLLCAAVGTGVESGARGANWVWVVVLLCFGFALASLLVAYPVILQTETEVEYLGRVVATSSALQAVGALAAPIAAAALVSWVGLGATPIAGGAGLVVLGGLLVIAGRRTASDEAAGGIPGAPHDDARRTPATEAPAAGAP